MKKKPQHIGKPAAWLYHPAFLIVSLYYRIRYRVHINNSAFRGEKGGCIILATHTSNKDHFLTAMSLYPRRVTFVMSEHFFAGRLLRPILKIMRAIPKKMFCPDTRSVLNMIRAIREGNCLVLFPEGRLTCNGASCPITPGTAELVRNLSVPVYTITAEGAGKTFPKWAKKPRIGRIDVNVSKLFEGDELKSMTLAEIDSAIDAAIRHNAWESLPDVNFKVRDAAEGLEGILWKCPECGAEHSLICKNNAIICQNCSLKATVNAHGQIAGAPCGIKTISDWYNCIAATLDLSSPLTSECIVGATDGDPKKDGVMRREIGKGVMSLSREGFTFDGEIDGEETHIALLGKDCPGALPISVGDHFDVYYGGRLHFFTPMPNPMDTVKFVAYRDSLGSASQS